MRTKLAGLAVAAVALCAAPVALVAVAQQQAAASTR